MSADVYAGLKTDVYTFFTKSSGTTLLLSLPNWSLVTLRLESAGPVAVGTIESLTPVGTKGRLLPVNEDIKIVMVPLTRLFIAADSLQRVAVQVEPYPWLFEILNAVKALPSLLGRLLGRK